MSTQALRTATQAAKEPKSFPAMIEQLKIQVALALPKHLNADRMARIALTAFRQNPKLGKCDPASVFASVVIASQLGLEPNVLGQGYLVPYNDRRRGLICQFIPGWRGLVDLAQRSGRASVWAQAVYGGDEFDYEYGSKPFVHHKPKGERHPENVEHVYSVGWVKSAEHPIIEVWPVAAVWKHRDRYNKVGAEHYSFANPVRYAQKVPLLQVLKYMPASPELSLAVNLDNAVQSGQRLDLKDAIEGTFTTVDDEPPALPEATEGQQQQGESPASSGGAYVPFYSDESAIAELRKHMTLPELNQALGAITVDYEKSNRALPQHVHGAYSDRKAAIEQAAAKK